ncbi:invasion associated locus B family protein [Oricola sp.]|uniref:invasion associated locus B family protein n=1 Tax=Oricola sp. TaxID=1979950 RepID=UPI0025F0CE74|nr:invasion associated locus B family protein [Oricola sp.]MCI5076131.1 invasion associated locus B family protein [Oricola sp.]
MNIRTVAASALLAGLCAAPVSAAGLPNGATSLNETYGAWRVVCQSVTKNEATNVGCTLVQVLSRKGSKSPAFVIRLQPGSDGDANGRMIVPLGVSLKDGVTLQIDDSAETAPNPYSTCLRAGCMVPIKWPAKTVNGLKLGGTLKVMATGMTGQKATFEVSLKGFSAAYDRAATLISG